jgi:hypothetical protein
MTYNCKVCAYNTKDNSNYIRHMQSKKHSDMLIENSKIEAANNKTRLTCKYCSEIFAHKSSMSRHRIKCKEENMSCQLQKYKLDIEQLNQQLHTVNEKLNLATKEITILKECKNEYEKLLNKQK